MANYYVGIYVDIKRTNAYGFKVDNLNALSTAGLSMQHIANSGKYGNGYRIYGYPTKSGTFSYKITVYTNGTHTGSYVSNASIKILPAIGPTISTTSFINATIGKSYSQTITASGSRTITYSIIDGELPPGLSFNNGTISGIPTYG